jgi:tetratricopeptide (TPR) repeat protein
MKLQFRIYLILFFLSFGHYSFSNDYSELDSLKALVAHATNDTVKVDLLLKLSEATSWSDHNLSEQYAKHALQLSQQLNYTRGLAYSEFQLSRIYSDYEFDFSENLAVQSLEHAKAIDDSILMARVYNIMGILKYKTKNKDDALIYYNKSLDIYLHHDFDSLAAFVFNNLGILLDDSLSIEYYRKAVEINIKNRNHLGAAINYLNLGYQYMELGKLKESYDYLQQSLKIADKNDFTRLLPWLFNNLSHYYLLKENYKEAVKYAEKALQISKEQKNKLQELDALSHLKEAYYNQSDIAMAYDYQEQSRVVSDSLNKHNRLKELDLLEMRYKFEEEQKQQKLEKELLKAQHSRKEITYLMFILIGVIVTMTFVFLFLLQRNKTHRKTLEQKKSLLEKEKLAKELEHKKKELTTNVMYLLKKNEFITSISDKLKNTDFDSMDNNDAIDRIISQLDKSITSDSWEEFEVRFQEVHVDFYNRLNKKYPDLTPNELRLCAFLRLNMSSKEISDITFQSPESLKTARYRLRKKLNLDRADNLVGYLTKF